MNEASAALAPPETAPDETASPPPLPSVSVRDLLIGVPIIWGVVVVANIAVVIALIVVYGLDTGMWDPPVLLLLSVSLLCLLWANAVAWFFVCRKYGRPLTRGFALNRLEGKTVRRCVLGGAAMALVAAVLDVFLTTGDSLIAELTSTAEGLLLFSVFALVVPVFEEVYYRGFLFPAFRNSFGPRWAIAIVAIWFALVHSVQLAGDWMGIPIILVMGLIWTLQRHRSDSLMPPIITHFTYNACLCTMSMVGFLFEGAR